jgi:hypothetical protein
MHHIDRHISSLFLAAAFAAPTAIMAYPRPQGSSVQVRVCDGRWAKSTGRHAQVNH